MLKQTKEDHARRMAKGLCPVHGACAPQVEGPFIAADGRSFQIGECSRRDCDIRLIAFNGPESYEWLSRQDYDLLLAGSRSPDMPDYV